MFHRLSRRSTTGSCSSIQPTQLQVIKIDGRGDIWSVAFLPDGKHIVSGGKEGKIRRWRVADGAEVETPGPMDAGSAIGNIAVSRDGKWVVSGTMDGKVAKWNAESHKRAIGFRGHSDWVRAVDVSQDLTRIATGSYDETASIWSLSTPTQRQFGPLQHDSPVVAAKFSPNGCLLATARERHNSICIYDCQDGHLLHNVPITVCSSLNQFLAWDSDSKQLFVLSQDGNINCLDASTGDTLSQWPIHSNRRPTCIALAHDGTFLAASANSSISFWDTKTHRQIGSVIDHTADVVSMSISADRNLAIGGGRTIALCNLCDVLYNEDLNQKIADLQNTVQDLRRELVSATQREDDLNRTIGCLRAQDESARSEIRRLNNDVQQFNNNDVGFRREAVSLRQIVQAHEEKHQCEVLYAEKRIIDAAIRLLKMMNTIGEGARANSLITNWLTVFTDRCISTLENIGDEARDACRHDEALAAYATALSLSPRTPNTLLKSWARTVLIRGSANEALSAAPKLPRLDIYQAICDVLEEDDRVKEAIECFQSMQNELPGTNDERARWESDFRGRCVRKLEELGDTAMGSQDYVAAIGHYCDALRLDPGNQTILIKRSDSRTSMGYWEDALIDADKLIEIDPSSHKGYEMQHAALQHKGRYSEAFEAFKMMLLRLERSPDPCICELRRQYVDATSAIRMEIEQTLRHMPRVLINTTTGCLYDKEMQKEAFEKLPIYDELRSSMTTRIDHARIRTEVKKYYEYVMFSHRWENNEPLFQKVEKMSIYELEKSSPNDKLHKFCKLIHSLGFQWVWSDTCCIDRKDTVVLQESLIAMFTWYRGSSLTIVYLRDVSSEFQQPGDLRRSIWNTRAWTYQEYVAAETVQFYTKDWKPYLGLTMSNHKESPAIISEMQQLTGVTAQQLAVLRPGLDRVREKLYLASMRRVTLTEDVAYSLLGIFNAAIPVIYGEGDRAVGRLLEHILTGSGDATVLAWTGRMGSYNSCLPVDLTVYEQLVPPHVPLPIETVEMDSTITALQSSLPDLSLAVTLHDRLKEIPAASLSASRLRLPSIVFRLNDLTCTSGPDPVTNHCIYHATTSTFGDIEIKTADNLTGMADLCLVHPWIRPLLDQEFSHGAAHLDRTTQALRFVARLRQPFGALLFEPQSRVEYRRVATDSLIMVRVREEVPLTELIDNVRTIEVQ